MIKTLEKSDINGDVVILGSKSHTIRALLLATLAKGKSVINKPLFSEDTKACINVCRSFGAEIIESETKIEVVGVDGNIDFKDSEVDVLNSGTTLYLAAALACLQNNPITFTGDHSIQGRSAANLLNALISLGAKVEYLGKDGCAPFSISGPIKSGKCFIDCPTSQYLSALLMMLPLANGNFEVETGVLLEKPYVEMTLWWLEKQFVMMEKDADYKKFFIPGGQKLSGFEIDVPADFSSAAFFFGAAAITGCELNVMGPNLKDTQGDKDVVRILNDMGCEVENLNDKGVRIKGSKLTGISVDMESIPDALPILSVVGCFAEGETVLYNAAHTRTKETDRIAVMAQELKKMGADITERPDGLVIRKSDLTGAEVKSHDDHRVAMSLAVASLRASGKTTIEGCEAAAVTFPNFFELLESVKK